MAQISIELKDESKVAFFLELLGSFNYVKILSPNGNGQAAKTKPKPSKKRLNLSPGKRKIVEDLKGGLREVELHRQGKIKLKTWEEFLPEWEKA